LELFVSVGEWTMPQAAHRSLAPRTEWPIS
jgi:hypothetical protein